jgi:hypothetical protein
MSVEYTGDIVTNEAYKVKKLMNQLREKDAEIASLKISITSMNDSHDRAVTMLLAKIEKLQAAKPAAKPSVEKTAKKRGRKCLKKEPPHQRQSMSA